MDMPTAKLYAMCGCATEKLWVGRGRALGATPLPCVPCMCYGYAEAVPAITGAMVLTSAHARKMRNRPNCAGRMLRTCGGSAMGPQPNGTEARAMDMDMTGVCEDSAVDVQ